MASRPSGRATWGRACAEIRGDVEAVVATVATVLSAVGLGLLLRDATFVPLGGICLGLTSGQLLQDPRCHGHPGPQALKASAAVLWDPWLTRWLRRASGRGQA